MGFGRRRTRREARSESAKASGRTLTAPNAVTGHSVNRSRAVITGHVKWMLSTEQSTFSRRKHIQNNY